MLNNILGLESTELSAMQMCIRALVIFFISMIYVRIAGIRTLGKSTSFDHITALIFGTLMGNAIFNAHIPFVPLLLASLLFMVLHRLMAFVSYKNSGIGKLIKGVPVAIISNGIKQKKAMNKTFISEYDIAENLRLEENNEDLDSIKDCYLERSGKLSFIKKSMK